MKFLVATAQPSDSETISTLLAAHGHEEIQADTGARVVDALRDSPDFVILEAQLPGISGFECCRLIKKNDKARHIQVIILMPGNDLTAWARFAESGADDFIELPLRPHILKSKLKLLTRIHDLYQRLDANHRHAEQEIRLAKHMFDSITKRQPKEIEFLHFWNLSAGHFCGDLFIFDHTPQNDLHIFLGDFTGHGLSAAIGALPVSDLFFSMTGNGASLAETMSAINTRLYEIMPTGKFCSAAMLKLSADGQKVEIWNGGLPPILLVDNKFAIHEQCASFHLPLGISSPDDFDAGTQTFELDSTHAVVLYSDGLTEAQNTLGEDFGNQRLANAIARKNKSHPVFSKIQLSVLAFLEGLEPHDDISLAVIQTS